jgi:hypothetical protein
MTGTSPVVLPFCCIDDRHFNVKVPLIAELRDLYIERAVKSIAAFRAG